MFCAHWEAKLVKQSPGGDVMGFEFTKLDRAETRQGSHTHTHRHTHTHTHTFITGPSFTLAVVSVLTRSH